MPKVLMGPGPLATTTAAGQMSAADKIKLNGITAGAAVTDVQVNGTSVLSNGVANVPVASGSTWGVTKAYSGYGIDFNGNGAYITAASLDNLKAGTQQYRPVVSSNQHQSVFYGLAKAAGDTTQALSDNAVGTYTTEAKAAIKTMLGIDNSSNTLIVTITETTSQGVTTYSADKTVAEIKAAYDAGSNVYAVQVFEISNNTAEYDVWHLIRMFIYTNAATSSYAEFQWVNDGIESTLTIFGDGDVQKTKVDYVKSLNVVALDYVWLNFPVAEGTYCTYDGWLYKANTAIATREDFNYNHWDSTSVGQEIDAKYTKPSGGIPSSDMASAVQTSLGKADTAYQKPSGGIPASDIASGVIPDVSGKIDKPSNPATGSFLVYNGTNWVAQTLSTWQGGNY